MTYRIRITENALVDISKAVQWYEEKQVNLGVTFFDTVEEHLERLKTDTVDYKIIEGEVRRLLISKFPYIVYYKREAEENAIVVLGVLHDRQDKQIIENRLK